MESVKEAEGPTTEMKYSPPYVAFGTFRNFLDTLKTDGIPNKINRSVMVNLSGASQSHLTSAFKALRLVESDGEPTSALRELLDVHGSEEQWPATFKKVLDGAYAEIIGDLDVSTASPQELEDRFRDPGGMDHSMNDKAVRFYLAALKAAKVELSPYLKKRRQKTTSKRRSSRANGSGETSKTTAAETRKSEVPTGCIDYPVYFKNNRKATIIVPVDLTEQECQMIGLTLPLIEAYAKAQVTTEETENIDTEAS